MLASAPHRRDSDLLNGAARTPCGAHKAGVHVLPKAAIRPSRRVKTPMQNHW